MTVVIGKVFIMFHDLLDAFRRGLTFRAELVAEGYVQDGVPVVEATLFDIVVK